MKNVKGIMSLLLLSLMATSCISLNGQIDVKQTMAAKKKSGFLNLKTKEIQIQPDLYKAELQINGNKNYTLKLEGRDTISIPIKSNTNLNMPANGKVVISHNDIGQPFDISGLIATDVTFSGRQDAVESCSWTVTENHCKKVCASSTSCNIECHDEVVTLYGQQEIIFHYKNTYRDLAISFLKVDKGEELASFHGSNTEVEKIIDFQSVCR